MSAVDETNLRCGDNQELTRCDIETLSSMPSSQSVADCPNLELRSKRSFITTSEMVDAAPACWPPFDEISDDRRTCNVCGDYSTGYYHCVLTCNGCKEFFEQTVQNNLVYTCGMEKKCIIDRLCRRKCLYCWYDRCIEVGMKMEGIICDNRTGIGNRRVKRLRLEHEFTPKISCFLSTEEELVVSKLIDSRPNIIPLFTDVFPIDTSDDSVDVNVFLNCCYTELRLVIDWSRKVPGFCDLLLEDQISLLKSSFGELNILRLAFRSLDCEAALRFTEHFSMTYEQCLHVGCDANIIEPLMEFVARLRAIGIDQTEFCILNAVVLTYPDAAGVTDRTAVITLQSRFLCCLQKYSSSRYPSTPCRYGKILLRLPALRTISARLADRLFGMSLDSDIKVNPVDMLNTDIIRNATNTD